MIIIAKMSHFFFYPLPPGLHPALAPIERARDNIFIRPLLFAQPLVLLKRCWLDGRGLRQKHRPRVTQKERILYICFLGGEKKICYPAGSALDAIENRGKINK